MHERSSPLKLGQFKGVYDPGMRRIQIHLDDTVDDRLAVEARRRSLSKAAFIRLLIRQGFPQDPEDPVDAVIGTGDGEGVDDIDATVYGR